MPYSTLLRSIRPLFLFGFVACYQTVAIDGGDPSEMIRAAEEFELAKADRCGFSFIGDVLRPDLQRAIEEGRTKFNAHAAEQCINWLDTNSCIDEGSFSSLLGQGKRLPGWCRKVYEGNIAAGDPCKGTFECIGDATCKPLSEELSECRLRDPVGASCFSSETCSTTLDRVPVCIAADSETRRCVSQQVSKERASLHEPCGNQVIDEDNVYVNCEAEWVCSSNVQGVCR